MAKQMTNNRLKRVRPYAGYRDYGWEQFALVVGSEERSDDGGVLQLVQQRSSGNAESGTYGRLWAQECKGDEDALPTTEEVVNGILNWTCNQFHE